MFPHVSEAEYRSGYKVWLKFEDGAEGVIDLESELQGPVFAPLRKPEEFKRFTVHPVAKTLVWPNGADFAPEYLKSKMA
jgi:hypothetical protein